MAFPGDPSRPAAKGPGVFAGARLTPDDFEHLAAAFRPSWEFDEAPFTGSGTMSPADMRMLQGGGTHADVRAAVAVPTAQPAPAPYAPPQAVAAPLSPPQAAPVAAHSLPKPAPVSHEPEDSVIIDRSITAADIAAAARTPIGPPLAVVAPAPPATPPVAAPDRMAQTRIVTRPQVSIPAAPESTGSFAAGAALGRSKRPLWIGLGAGVVALAAVGIWASSGPSDASQPVPPATAAKTADAPAHDIPPPPETTTAAAPAPAPPPAPPKTVAVSSLAQVPTPMVATPPPPPQPVRPPPPTVSLQSLPQAPRPAPAPAPAPAPRPAARPKPTGATIVHDVPF
jgi:hypothetical protein